MNLVSNIFNYVKSFFYTPKISEDNDNQDSFIIVDEKNPHYFFINTANIYNATELLLDRLKTMEGESIKIYLLKSHTLEPLSDILIVNNYNIEWIKNKLLKQRRHLHTMVDAIDSFIEYNENYFNYTIFY